MSRTCIRRAAVTVVADRISTLVAGDEMPTQY